MGKKVLSITVDEKVLTSWKGYAEDRCINSSQLIERLMKEYLKKEDRK